MPRSARMGTTSSRKRRHWPGWPTPTLRPSRARASNVYAEREVVVLREPGDLLRAGAEAALRVDEGLLREGCVQVVLAEVVPGERAAELRQGATEVPVPGLQVELDLAGVGIRVADVDRHAGHDDDLLGVAALGLGAALEVVVERLALGDGGGVGEDALTDRGAQVAALLRVAGLEDDRLALRRPGDVERADDLEVLALVVKGVLLARIEEGAGGAVAGERVFLVGVPQALGDLDELQAASVAGVVVEVLRAGEVARRAGVTAGDHVPAGPAAGDELKGGEAAGDVERVVVGGGHGGDQAEVARADREGRQQRERLKAVEVVRRGVGGDELAVDDEDEVELGLLGQAGLLDVPVDVNAGVDGDVLVEPQVGRAGAAGAVGDGAELELALRGGHALTSVASVAALSAAARSASRLATSSRTSGST
jgi:hypothetical protein